MNLPSTLTPAPGHQATTLRPDLYGPIHKALRHCQCETLTRLGRTDANDPVELQAALAALEDLLHLNELHQCHEDEFLSPSVDDRMPSAVLRVGREHLHHAHAIAALRADAAAMLHVPPGARPHSLHQLYLRLARFIADSLLHMDFEESVMAPALHTLLGDAELDALHQRLRASLTPEEATQAARWMLASLNPVERQALIEEAMAALPVEMFEGLLALLPLPPSPSTRAVATDAA